MIPLHFVAFIDILGFSEMVMADCQSEAPGSTFLPKLRDSLETALAEGENLEVNQFSDSVIISDIFANNPERLDNFVASVARFQMRLFENGVLCRGGITSGRHYSDTKILFSQALIEAYEIESQRAINPRIIISQNLLELVYPLRNYPEHILRDSDGECFVDFLYDIDDKKSAELISPFMPDLMHKSSSVRSKISWLCNYVAYKSSAFDAPPHLFIRSAAAI